MAEAKPGILKKRLRKKLPLLKRRKRKNKLVRKPTRKLLESKSSVSQMRSLKSPSKEL